MSIKYLNPLSSQMNSTCARASPPAASPTPAACAASFATAGSTPAVTYAPTCASTRWTNPSSAVSVIDVSVSLPPCATMCASTRGSGPTSATSARARTHSLQAYGHTRRVQGTGHPAQGPLWGCRPTHLHLPLLSWHRFLTRPPWCITYPPWCFESA